MRYFLIFLLISQSAFGQREDGILFGTVTLKNNTSYTGQIRFEDQIGAWDDMFEAYKNEPQIQEQIKIQGYEQNKDASSEVFEFSFMKLWENKDSKSRFAFKCQFGHIDKIEGFRDRKSATVILKNGKKIKLRKRGSAIGSEIVLFHQSLGKLEFRWENIKQINFTPASRSQRSETGEKMYAKALTVDGIYEGYIVWDFDEEAFGDDILDGYHQKVAYKIKFQDISSLKPEREGSMVTLKNGKEIFLRNSSDVNKDNDGVLIKNPEFGILKIPWQNLIKADFVSASGIADHYDKFEAPEPLFGKVETKGGQTYKGKLIYDLDETWDIEMLDGRLKGMKYYIPFYLIKKITPQNFNYSAVELKDGRNLMMGEEGDVNHRNNGILVWLSSDKTKYIAWKDLKEVTFSAPQLLPD